MPVGEFREDKYELTDLSSANIEGIGLYINFIVQKLDELIVIRQGSLFSQGSPKEVLYDLENQTDLIPNQIVRLISSVEEETGRKIPHCLSPEEFNQFLKNSRFV